MKYERLRHSIKNLESKMQRMEENNKITVSAVESKLKFTEQTLEQLQKEYKKFQENISIKEKKEYNRY